MEGLGQENGGLPVRLVSRLTTEFALMNLRLSLRLVPGRLETSIVAQMLIRGALPELAGTYGTTGGTGGPALPAGTPLVGSVSAIARAFGRSPETMRRHVQVLAGQGFFTVEPDGVRLAPTQEAGARILAYLRDLHDNMLWLVEELDSWGLVTRRAPEGQEAAQLGSVLRTALDLRMFGYDSFRSSIASWTSMSVWNALSAVSVRHITTDRGLSWQFARRSTPDALRRPTSLRALCAVTGLPYATVWRHLAALEAEGKVGRKDGDYAMLTGQLLTPEIEDRVAHYVRHTLGRVDALVANGMDPAAIPSLYFGSRPAPVPMQ